MQVCHVPPDNPSNAQFISVAASAVPAHVAHGDQVLTGNGACSVGVGECRSTGTLICSAQGLVCDATPLSPPEATEASCNDGLDNDCDGLIDAQDDNCAPTTACASNPLWQPVDCTTPLWVWSSDRSTSTTVATADANHVLWVGDQHVALPNTCSLDGTGWVSTAVFTMTGCNASWYHLGGAYTGNCGGHDGDQVRRLTMDPLGCFDYGP
jgi:hypothetical protein